MRIEIFSGAFWGIVLILTGILIIIKYLFNIQIPVFRILIAALFIYLGIRMLMGNYGFGHWRNYGNSSAFTNNEFTYSPNQNNYNCVFGSSFLDLTNVKITENKVIEISVAFGEFKVKLRKDQNVEIFSNTAFGDTRVNYENTGGFGTRNFKSPDFDASAPHLTIRTNAAFGSLKIYYNE